MADYIERQAVIDLLEGAGEESGSSVVDIELTIEAVQNDISAADVAPVVHAAWIFFRGVGEHFPRCSRCGEEADEEIARPYCAFCGARMDMPHKFDYSDDRKRKDGGRK